MLASTIQLAVFRNRLRLIDVKSGTVVERPAVHRFSAAGMIIADREMLELEFGELVRQIPRSLIFVYPTIEVISVEAELQPVERDALERALLDAGVRKVVFPNSRA